MNGWTYLVVAIVAEIAATVSLKMSDGMSRLWPTLGVVVGGSIAFVALSQAVKTVEIGTVYAVWSGVGTAVVAVLGILFFAESTYSLKFVAIALIVTGVVLLNLVSPPHFRTGRDMEGSLPVREVHITQQANTDP
jgi:small multidrug resistance pump